MLIHGIQEYQSPLDVESMAGAGEDHCIQCHHLWIYHLWKPYPPDWPPNMEYRTHGLPGLNLNFSKDLYVALILSPPVSHGCLSPSYCGMTLKILARRYSIVICSVAQSHTTNSFQNDTWWIWQYVRYCLGFLLQFYPALRKSLSG